MTIQVGDTLLGKLQVVRVLGTGAMGAVYEVEHLLTKHRRALKVLHKHMLGSGVAVARFIREAGVAGQIDSPWVVDTFDAGQLEDGSPYVLMEMLVGRTLEAQIQMHGALPSAVSAHIISQVCEGLGAAHRQGIIHRDLKPGNIFLVDDGQRWAVRLLDFGVSKFDDEIGRLTTEGTILGTPYYMSPEQSSGKTVDPRSDLYSLGVIMYECLTGDVPFVADSFPALVARIHTGHFPPIRTRVPDLDPRVEAIVEKAMAAAQKDRYQSAVEMRDALEPFAKWDKSTEVEAAPAMVAPLIDEMVSGEVALPPLPPEGSSDLHPAILEAVRAVKEEERKRPSYKRLVPFLVVLGLVAAALLFFMFRGSESTPLAPNAAERAASENAQPSAREAVTEPTAMNSPATMATSMTEVTEAAETSMRRRTRPETIEEEETSRTRMTRFERATKAGLRTQNPYGMTE